MAAAAVLFAAVLNAGSERGALACLCRPNSGTFAARLRLTRSWLIALPLNSLTADLPTACSSCGAVAELGAPEGPQSSSISTWLQSSCGPDRRLADKLHSVLPIASLVWDCCDQILSPAAFPRWRVSWRLHPRTPWWLAQVYEALLGASPSGYNFERICSDARAGTPAPGQTLCSNADFM